MSVHSCVFFYFQFDALFLVKRDFNQLTFNVMTGTTFYSLCYLFVIYNQFCYNDYFKIRICSNMINYAREILEKNFMFSYESFHEYPLKNFFNI